MLLLSVITNSLNSIPLGRLERIWDLVCLQKILCTFSMTSHSEFKCRDYPWFALGEEATSTFVLLHNLKQLLEDRGFKVYASLDYESEVSFHIAHLPGCLYFWPPYFLV